MKRKSFLSIVMVLFLLLGSILVVDFDIDIVQKVCATVREVGPGKTYATIQEGIDAAQPGDEVYVYTSIYYENVIVNKTINLTGENKETTIIDGMVGFVVIYVEADYVNISGFTIRNADYGFWIFPSNHSKIAGNIICNTTWGGGGIVVLGSNHTITENTLYNNTEGISIYLNNNTVDHNFFYNNIIGIHLVGYNNMISNNEIFNTSQYGIPITGSYNKVFNNTLKKVGLGGIEIANMDTSNNTLLGNTIDDAEYGIRIWLGANNNSVLDCFVNNSRSTGIILYKSQNCYFINCTMANSSIYDISVSISNTTLLNTTFNKSKVHFFDNSSTLTIQWYLHTKVLNPDFTPAIGTRIRVEDNNNGSFRETYVTWYNGWKRWIVVTEYIENSAGKTYFTPYNVSTWNRTLTAYVDPEPKMEKSEFVVLQLGKPIFYKKLYKGWNLVSIPLLQNDTSTSSVLSSIAGKYNTIQYYNSTDNRWYFYPSGDLTNINSTMGIWIHMKEDAVLSLNGSNPIRVSIILNASGNGWNLIGYPSLYDDSVSTALAAIGGGYDAVQAFDSSDFVDPWKHRCINKPEELNDLKIMRPGYGYWLHMSVDCVFDIGPKMILASLSASEDPFEPGKYVITVMSLNAPLPMIDTELLIYDSSLNQYASLNPLKNNVTLQVGVPGVDMNCTYYDANENWYIDASEMLIVKNGASGDLITLINRLTGEQICKITFP